MRVVILYNEAADDAAPDVRDVLVQRDAVANALRQNDHEVEFLPWSLDLDEVRRRLTELAPQLVFNLVESVDGSDRLAPAVTMFLELEGIAFTGNPTAAMMDVSDKAAAKRRMIECGLPTPPWIDIRDEADESPFELANGDAPVRYIIKPIFEHASVGMDDDAVVEAPPGPDGIESVRKLIRERAERCGLECFAEKFIAGREFNLSLFEYDPNDEGLQDGRRRVVCLPPAEIDFSAFPANKPRIVGYRAKWDESSFEYQRTPRRFDLPPGDADLIVELSNLAGKCWKVFGLRGYARVDFRVDESGRPWILEVNTNPCLSPDAGFAAALAEAGVGFADAIQCIAMAGLSRSLAR